MDVIANNVANVNTIGYKTARATFRDAFYQNLSGATSANPDVGRTGVNPQQIGLGLSMGSIDNIMTQGASQRTDFGMDIMIQNDGFFVVSDSSGTFFTRAGNVTKDARGNLGVNGMQLMGWDVFENEETGRWEVNRSNLVPLSMSGSKANMPSEPTTFVELAGNLNIRDLVNVIRFTESCPEVVGNATATPPIPPNPSLLNQVKQGDIMRTMTIFDSLGHSYVIDVRFTYHNTPGANNYWTFEFMGEEVFNDASPPVSEGFVVHAWLDGTRSTAANPISPAHLRIHAGMLQHGIMNNANPPVMVDMPLGAAGVDPGLMRPTGTLAFDSMGNLLGMGPATQATGTGTTVRPDPVLRRPIPTAPGTWSDEAWQVNAANDFKMHIVPIRGTNPRATFGDADGRVIVYDGTAGAGNIGGVVGTTIPIGSMTFSMLEFFNRGGMNTNAGFEPINGNPPGTLRDISIGRDGTVTGMFTNGRLRVLGQIPVAMFSNPAGLQRMGSNLWAATANSGSFDGIGEIGDIQAGALEMSNVDLAQEFTDMIVTQRGFQASSRLISVSDEMIQELVNLRR
ncbi:MAG: flagellar hook-basal body complex protein [Defluviitaleaceae bacterium]|nr:flagellar hook-basal body complex protein [Defluviitaleaceae bacterium]